MVAHRTGVRRAVWSVALAALAATAFFQREPIRDAWRNEHVRRAMETADADQGVLTPRLVTSSRSRTLLATGMSVLPPPRRSTNAAVTALLDGIDDVAPSEAMHRRGVALFIKGKSREAAEQLRVALSREQHAAWWNDLAAAEIRVGDAARDPERYLAALEAADRALALDARLSQAHFNRAIAIERLGFERASIGEWEKALELEGSSSWASAVSIHLAELSRKRTAREQWTEAQQQLASLTPVKLNRLIDQYPQEARLWGEAMFLPLWGKAHLSGERGDLYLDAARVIGNRIASRSGERILQGAVAVVDAARTSSDPRRLPPLAQALSAYYDGRMAFKEAQLDVAARELERARAGLAANGSPMAAVAELYLAMTAIRMNQTAAARTTLVALRERASATDGHESLAAYAEQYIALVDAMSGRWGDALETATSSRDRFERLGERGNAGVVELTIGDVLGFLGQPQLAWRHYVRSAAAFSAAGLWDQLQLCAAEMNQVEMRRHRWTSALAMSRIELTLGSGAELVAHAHLRAGAAAFASGDIAAASLSLRNARIAAASNKNSETRERLFADIAGVEGRIIATSDPAGGVARLTESIDFQKHADRAFALPELYLQRGRAQLARGAHAFALADFEKGIDALELQRSRVRDYELRAGLFDDARDLFGEAVSVSLYEGQVRTAFEYLERGRARALLDELGDGVRPPAKATLAAVQQSLEPGMLLVSYALLPDRIAIFVIDRNEIAIRFSDIPTAVLREQVRDLIRAVKERHDISGIAGKVYDALLLPIRDLLPRATTLVIVPDAALEQLPFAALYDRRANAYFLESHETLLAPSAAVFVACLRRANDTGASQPQSIAVFANPGVPDDSSLPSLPAAEKEATSFARLYARTLVLRRRDATAASFRRDAPRYEIVQFSGHTEINAAEPWKSALMFDQRLTARDIASMHFPHTRLTILGACSTLAPNADRVEGTSPIARSFLVAGIPAVIGSLWDVDDGEAAAVMTRLHQRLARGIPAAAALREVQRDMIRDPALRHPAAWAAFTVLGADRSH